MYKFDDDNNMICVCGKSMIYHFDYNQDNENSPLYSSDDTWGCNSCSFSLPSRRYSDWFGEGDTHQDLAEYLENNESQPLRVFFSGYMVCVIYPEEVAVFGYDGNEYTHSFWFTNEEPHIQPSHTLEFQLGVN